MIDLEKEKDNFRNHKATFTDYGNIKVLDFKNPNSSDYRIRFLFEEDYCRLHISGDLGELVATNYNNMTYEKFGAFVHSLGYFEEKVDCLSRKIYVYDIDKAKKDLDKLFEKFGIEDGAWGLSYDSNSEAIEDILEDFDSDRGIGSKGYDLLSEMISDAWEYVGDIGKENTNILGLYMLAFELAQKQLKEGRNGC